MFELYFSHHSKVRLERQVKKVGASTDFARIQDK